MREAVETAKLRLFLKLVSAAEPNYRAENIGIEPLPDIDFNIKSGNTLIGYANEDEVKAMMLGTLEITSESLADAMSKMYQLAKVTSRYKELQLGAGDYRQDDFKAAKSELTARQAELKAVLDKELRKTYGGNVSDEQWINNYMPFHWVSEFYSIIVENGGFDVVIGNPPYVEYSDVRRIYTIKDYVTLKSGNLYAYIVERSIKITKNIGNNGMIIPLSAYCTERMNTLQQYQMEHYGKLWISFYAERPSKLFDGVDRNLAIFISNVSNQRTELFTTHYRKWSSNERAELFSTVFYHKTLRFVVNGIIPKVGNAVEDSILILICD